MRIKTITLLALLLCCSWLSHAQSDTETDRESRTTELGLNITNTLSGFLNSGGQIAPLDPYLLSFKSIKNNVGVRVGLNFRVQNSNNFESFLGGNQRITQEISANLRIGFEKRIPLSTRFTLFWGVDGVTQYLKDKVDFFSQNGIIKLDETQYGFGGGPVIGIMYHVHSRVYLSTESYVYAVYKVEKNTEILDLNSPNPTIAKTRKLDIIPVYPNALYITFLF